MAAAVGVSSQAAFATTAKAELVKSWFELLIENFSYIYKYRVINDHGGFRIEFR